jgi:hypothetical protein
MIFGASPPHSNVLAALILFYLNWLVHGCFVAKMRCPELLFYLQKYKGKIGYSIISTVPYLKTFLVFR